MRMRLIKSRTKKDSWIAHLESIAEPADLVGEAQPRGGRDELEHGEWVGGVPVEDGQRERGLDVVDERVADARVLGGAVVLHVGRPLGRAGVEHPAGHAALAGRGGARPAHGEGVRERDGPVLGQPVALWRRQQEGLPPGGQQPAPTPAPARRRRRDRPPPPPPPPCISSAPARSSPSPPQSLRSCSDHHSHLHGSISIP
jgi:hypothetical protein